MERYIEPEEIIRNNLFAQAVSVMDNDLRENVHSELAPCTELEFLTEYMQRHYKKYGKAFVLP